MLPPSDRRHDRRTLLRWIAVGGAAAIAPGCGRRTKAEGAPRGPGGEAGPAAAGPYDGKADDLVLHTERPPNLEMPSHYFEQDLTPNEAMFVRWHLSVVPTSVDESSYRLRVGGLVERPLELSLTDLRVRFSSVSVVAVNQCSGNGRASFSPRVPGVQWGRGAVGNARWTGVRLSDVLDAAGAGPKSVEVVFGGLDRGPLESVPDFEKSLPIEVARGPEPLLAWAVNDAPLPMMNGFPLRLVVPGWYSTYWVKALDSITVIERAFDGYWMKRAYRVPANEDANEAPDALSQDTVPIGRMNVRSLIARPLPGERLRVGSAYELQGTAWDGGSGIARVEVSTDGGLRWTDARLDRDLGRFSWRRWRSTWTPGQRGSATLVVRATSRMGERQGSRPRWNRSGYMKNDPERLDVEVT